MKDHPGTVETSARYPAWPFPAGEVHVWIVTADDHLDDLDALYEVLSGDERERASRFRRDRDRDRWIASRSSLRRVLGGCLGREPGEIEFRLGPNEKPELVSGENESTPHFNLSHSGEMVLIAVASTPVGVDVEQIRDSLDLPGMARRVLQPEEVTALEALPARRRTEGFIAAWTRKEAYLKARGLGISEMSGVGVNVDPDEQATLRGADLDPEGGTRWTLVDLKVDAGYRAALAVHGRARVVRRTLGRTDASKGG